MLAVLSAVRHGCRQVWRSKQPDTVLAGLRYFSSDSDDSDSSDDEVDKKSQKDQAKNAETLKKLNMLINSMIEKEFSTPPPQSAVELKLAQPKKRLKKDKEEAEQKLTEEEKFDISLENAAQDVAKTLSGESKEAENELLHKLLYGSSIDKSARQEEIPSETKGQMNLSDLITGMKIDHSSKASAVQSEGRAQQVRRILSRRGRVWQQQQSDAGPQHWEEREPPKQKFTKGRVDLFDSPPLGIFKPAEKAQPQKGDVPVLETWQRLQERELKMAVTHPPSNIYEEMILWTDQGKLWKFPINNEQGLEEEAKVFFADHVFLEQHLEPWCPPRGPIRHFMELVCVGLSKNPYITVKDKREHIEWYRNYFEDKKALLLEVGAITENTSPQQNTAE